MEDTGTSGSEGLGVVEELRVWDRMRLMLFIILKNISGMKLS